MNENEIVTLASSSVFHQYCPSHYFNLWLKFERVGYGKDLKITENRHSKKSEIDLTITYQVVIVFGRDVERISLLCVELGGVQNDGDLTLQHDEDLKSNKTSEMSPRFGTASIVTHVLKQLLTCVPGWNTLDRINSESRPLKDYRKYNIHYSVFCSLQSCQLTMVFLSVQLMPFVLFPLILRKDRRW